MTIGEEHTYTSVAIVAPFPPPFGGMAVQAEKLSNKLLNEGIKVIRITANPAFPFVLSALEQVKGVRTIVRFLLFLVSLRALRRTSVVHVFAASHFYFFAVVVPSLIASRIFGNRSILNYRGGDADGFFKKWGLLVRLWLRLADVIAVPSSFLKEIFLRRFGINAEILPNIADLDRFRFCARGNFLPILIVSRQLEPIYNHACILKAFSIILQRYPEARLKIVGGGSELEQLQQIVIKMGLNGIEFLGPLNHEKLAHVYEESHIMVNASLIDNFPGSILEAFMCGLPVVTTAVGGIPAMVKDGVTGILVPSNDFEKLAKGVQRLIEEPKFAKELVENAHRAVACNSWERVKAVLFDLYGT